MPLPYTIVKIYTDEDSRHEGKPVYQAISRFIQGLKISARCMVTRGIAGCYENGEIATFGIEVLSYNMPLEITVIIPSREKDKVIPVLEEMTEDGIMIVEEKDVCWHKSRKHLIPRQVKVKDIMTSSPTTVTLGTSASKAMNILMSARFHGIPVVDEAGRPVGMITQGDLIRRAKVPVRVGLLADFAAHHLKSVEDTLNKLTASGLMSTPPVTAQEDGLLSDAVETMLKNKLKRLPVVDKDGKLTGILSRLDVFKTILEKNPDWQSFRQSNITVANIKTVREIMRGDTPVVAPDAPIWDAIQLIDTTDIKRVAVVDKTGKLLGLISDSVLMTAFSAHKANLWDYFMSKLAFTEAGHKHKEFLDILRARTAREVMRTDIIPVNEDSLIDDAIRLMVSKKLKRIPVLDANGIFKGMLTRDSILRAGQTEK